MGLPRWGKLGLAILVVQAIFWLAFVPVFIAPPLDRPDFLEIDSFATAEVVGPDLAGLRTAKFTDDPPGRELREVGYHATRLTFTLDKVPAEGLALLDNSGGDNARHYVNGALVDAPGSMSLERPTYDSLREGIVHISPGVLRTGENRIESVYLYSIAREGGLFPPLLDEYRIVAETFGWKAFLLNEFRLITTVMVFVVALFAGLAAIRARDRNIPLWLFFAAAAWTGHSLFFLWTTMPLAGALRGFAYAAITMFLAVAWAIFADAWAGHRLRYFRPAVWAIFLTGSVWCGWSLLAGGTEAFGRVEDAVEWVGIALSLATAARLGIHFVRHPEEKRYIEAAALVLLASLMLFYLYVLITQDLNRPYLTATQPIILVILVAAFFARNFALFRSREQLNEELETQLATRTVELEAAHEREKTFLRDQAHQDERRRIMRDMHDGMGSNLMSMLLSARRGKVDADSVARGLQTVIDEMRLMIDSMDSVGESLASALVLFRERAQAWVTEAGFTFKWDDRSHGDLPELDPRQVLQVFRILQEAITNALKHSDGDTIRITVTPAELRVADNGSSFVGPRHGGRGLDNMEARAGSIGGTFAIARAGGETVARIGLPASGRDE